MKIGIIGAGNIGATVARLFVNAGHEVALSNSRGPESLASLIDELGSGAQATTMEEAAAFGDVVLLAVPWRNPNALPSPETVAGKVVIDATNPYTAEGTVADLGESTSSEEVAKRLPGARIVKAFNTLWYKHLAEQGKPDQPVEQRPALVLAGDDAAAKSLVSTLIEDIGFAPIDTGSLHEGGKRQEPDSAVYGKLLSVEQVRQALA